MQWLVGSSVATYKKGWALNLGPMVGIVRLICVKQKWEQRYNGWLQMFE